MPYVLLIKTSVKNGEYTNLAVSVVMRADEARILEVY